MAHLLQPILLSLTLNTCCVTLCEAQSWQHGLKAVIFSQFLGCGRMFAHYLSYNSFRVKHLFCRFSSGVLWLLQILSRQNATSHVLWPQWDLTLCRLTLQQRHPNSVLLLLLLLFFIICHLIYLILTAPWGLLKAFRLI